MTRSAAQGQDEDFLRGVIDIGSNTVRLVVFGHPARAPVVVLNEKVTARLGRDLSETGRLPDKAMAAALGALRRFSMILADLGVRDVVTVATAAVRDSKNGPEFLQQVADLGLSPRLLSGKEEADAAASGVVGAFPGACGVVADLGGGSLELVSIQGEQTHEGVSLPLGTLRLPAMRAKGGISFDRAVHKSLQKAGWAADHPGPLYLVGGTWRAFANFAISQVGSPLSDPHGFELSPDEAMRVAKKITRMTPDELSALDRISSTRAAALPDAAALLRIMLDTLKPDTLVFSAWGLREGLLFQSFDPSLRKLDPLFAGVAAFARRHGAAAVNATMIAAWTSEVTADPTRANERVRLAAIFLAQAISQIEPNLRLRHALDWALHKRWIGLDTRGRGQLGAAAAGFCGAAKVPDELSDLAEESVLRDAFSWGLAARLCRRIGAGSRVSMLTSALRIEGADLVLWLERGRADLAADSVKRDLRTLAGWLGKNPVLKAQQGATTDSPAASGDMPLETPSVAL